MEVLGQEKNALLNLINHHPDIDETYLYAKDPYETRYQILINKQEDKDLKYCKHSTAFT